MTEQRTFVVTREIDATPEAIFQALTHPMELAFWLCHEAWTEPRIGGEFRVRWRNGWWARGVYVMVERPRRIELTWQGQDEPHETNLVFEIEALDTGSAVKVVHSGFSSDAIWNKAIAEAEKSWPQTLENLESVLTTGIDLRTANQPIPGIVPQELTQDQAVSEDIATDSGIYVAQVLKDGGAAEAGIMKGDVITAIGGMIVTDHDSLATTLSPYRAGDEVQVHFVRHHERGIVEVELKQQSIPEIAFDPQQIVDQVSGKRAELIADLRNAVSELTDELAGKRPAADQWSVKEILAHLSLSERYTQCRFTDIILGTTGTQYGGNPTVVPELLAMVLSAAPATDVLLNRLESDQQATLVLFAALRPEIVEMKARFRTMATALLQNLHTRDHLNQIKATVKAIKA